MSSDTRVSDGPFAFLELADCTLSSDAKGIIGASLETFAPEDVIDIDSRLDLLVADCFKVPAGRMSLTGAKAHVGHLRCVHIRRLPAILGRQPGSECARCL